MDLAELGLRFTPAGDEASNRALDQITEKSGRAEKATDALAASQAKAKTATGAAAAEFAKHTQALDAMTRAAGGAAGGLTTMQAAVAGLAGGLAGLAIERVLNLIGQLKDKIVDFVKDSGALAARFETMGVVMRVAGNNAGYTGAQMEALSKALQKSGISMIESRESLTNLATANIDLANAVKLGRAAQDLAVVGNINSSEAFARLVAGIKSGQIEILRTLGLNVNFQTSYERLAKSLHTTVDGLTESQRALARTNAVLAESANYVGIYEQAMGTAGKQVTSLKRYWEDLKVTFGDAFLPALTESVFGLADAINQTNAALKEMGRSDVIQAIGQGLGGAFKVVQVVATGVVYVVGQLLRLLGAMASSAAALARGDFTGAAKVGESFKKDYDAAAASYGKLLDKQLGLGKATAATTGLTQAQRIAQGAAARAATAHSEQLDALGQAMEKVAPKQKKIAELQAGLALIRADLKAGIGDPAAEKAAIIEGEKEIAQLKKSKEHHDRHAESLIRDAAAMTATTQATLALADAYGVSDTEALRAQARVEAVGKAIKSKGDVDAFVARQLAENAAKEAVTGAKTLADLQFDASARAIVNAQVAAGIITQDDANTALSEEAAIRPLLAAALSVEGKERERLLKTINDLRAAYRGLHKDSAIDGLEGALRSRLEQDRTAPDFTPLDDAIFKTNKLADSMAYLAESTQNAAGLMAGAFGKVGDAIGGVAVAQANARASIAQINADLAKFAQDNQNDPQRVEEEGRRAAERRRNAEVGANIASLESFKRLFKEKSVAYKVLTGLEIAYQTIQIAGSIKAMALDAIHTAKSIASALARGAADAAAGAAKMFSQLGVFAFPVVAAMVAALAALGLKAFGGGGSSPNIPSAEDRQKAQGAGSVLGDVTAKSESIAHALDLVAANTNKDLEYSNSMLRALRSIDQNIGTLTNALARQLGVGGVFDTSKLGLGTTTSGPGTIQKILNPISILLPGLFGTKKTTTLLDQGLTFDPQSLDAILNGGLSGDSYQDIATQTKKKFFGITYSNKTKTSTQTTPLGDDILAEMQRVIASLKDGVLAAAGALGVEGADAALKAFTVDLGTISFKDKTGEEIQQELNAIFGKLGDQLSEAVFPAISELQKAGEGAFETLVRVARQYQVIDVTLSSIGKTFGAVGVASLGMRENLIDLFGSLDDFVSQTQFFADNFLSEAERIAPIQAAVQKEFSRLGVTGVNTVDQFKQLVLGLDLTTASGQEMYASLLAVAPAFKKVFDYLNPDAAKASADGWKTVFQSMQDWIRTLNGEITSSVQSTAQAYSAFQSAALAARGGDLTAAGQVADLGKTYVAALKASASSEFELLQGLARARAIASSVQAYAASNAGMATGAGSATPFSPATSATGSTAPSYTYTPPAFATGGSFTIGGTGSGDSQDFGSWHGAPGEVVNVSRKDNMEAVADAMRALATELASLKEDNRVGFTALATKIGKAVKVLEDWDGAGLPPDRTAEEAA